MGPALWQRVGNDPPQELVQGVQNMQVLYGVDTNGDLLADNYVVASAVTNWAQVISLSVALLIAHLTRPAWRRIRAPTGCWTRRSVPSTTAGSAPCHHHCRLA